MIPLNLWEYQNAIKTLYSKCIEEICVKHKITRMELDILLFLANNPHFDTATEIVEIRYLSKSQVSASIKLLEKSGYLRKEYAEDNRKTAHLKICDNALDIVEDGKKAQERFVEIMLQGLSREEEERIRRYFEHIWKNINSYLKEETE